jgi:hypothetical protein
MRVASWISRVAWNVESASARSYCPFQPRRTGLKVPAIVAWVSGSVNAIAPGSWLWYDMVQFQSEQC